MSAFRATLLLALGLGASALLRGETELEKASRLVQAKRFPEAQALLDRIVKTEPREAEAWYQLGLLHWATQNSSMALECADTALRISAAKADYHVLRGKALGNLAQRANMFKALGLAKDACAAFERAVQLEPANRSAVSELFKFYLNVPGMAGGSPEKARALAERTQVQDPSRGHYFKGLIFQKQKNPGSAQAELRMAQAADPKFSAVYNALGYVELEMKQFDQALEHFRKQAELDPENPNSFDSLGDGWRAKGHPDEAIQAYRKALALDPLFIASIRSLGKSLEEAGRREEAIQHYRQCVQLAAQKGLPRMAEEAKERLKALGIRD